MRSPAGVVPFCSFLVSHARTLPDGADRPMAAADTEGEIAVVRTTANDT